MKKNLTVLALTGVLACALVLPAAAAQTTAVPISQPISTNAPASMPDSVLYYGTVQEVVKGEDGSIRQLRMDSERYGQYTMNITQDTLWIDSGNHTASDPADLKTGEGVYVFHSAISTDSLPPQTEAFAVVRNVPMDAGCAQYHEIEAVSQEGGQVSITTDNGSLYIRADDQTGLSFYGSDEQATLEDLQVGGYVMAWYGAVAESYPAQTHAQHLMLLPAQDQPVQDTLTRAELVMMLHEQAGKPVVNYAMQYTDVSGDAEYAEAVRWATSEKLVSGYDNGAFGPDDAVTREQLVTILWRWAGSPMLMDYPGLSQFSDAADISLWAQPALAWAHQNGYIAAAEGDKLLPQGEADVQLAQSILQNITKA